MPLCKDEEGGGTERDGSLTTEYCSHCYRQGGFIEPDITAEQMVEKVKGKMKSIGFPSLLAWFFARGVPGLKRWRN